MSSERVTLRYFDGCPNWEVARSRATEALRQIGQTEEISFQLIETAEEADRLGFRGSPTILIDGEDPFANANAPVGLSCRVYRTAEGMQGSPSVEQIVAALKEKL